MTKRNRSLPTPPGRRFGPEVTRPGEESGGLLEERLAQAAAMGKLDQFMDNEFKDNEQARKLASMMMGMTGMAPLMGSTNARPVSKATGQEKGSVPPPAEIVKAAQAGDVGALMDLLAREHGKRTGTGVATESKRGGTKPRGKKSAEKPPAKDDTASGFDREMLDALIAISSENGVSIDWLVTRAIKLYIRDYKATGRI